MKKFNKEFYNKDYYGGGKGSYATYDFEKIRHFYEQHADDLIYFFKPNSILEIGCAKGYLVDILLDRKIDIYGCDISEYAIETSKNKNRLIVCDVRDGLPYPDNFVDLICSYSTFEHIEDEYIPKIMAEIYRVSKNGFFLEVPVSLENKNTPWGDVSHVNYMPTSYWISQAYNSGWLLDMRRVKQIDVGKCHNVELSFTKVIKI